MAQERQQGIALAAATTIMVLVLYAAVSPGGPPSAPAADIVPEADPACEQMISEIWQPDGGTSAGLKHCILEMNRLDHEQKNRYTLIDPPLEYIERRRINGTAGNVEWTATLPIHDGNLLKGGSPEMKVWMGKFWDESFKFELAEWLLPPDYKQQEGETRIVFIHGGSASVPAVAKVKGVGYYYAGMTTRLANWTGMPVLAFDFATQPIVPWPQNMRFVMDYIEFALENGPDGPGRAGSIILVGDSEGSLLTMNTASTLGNSSLLTFLGYPQLVEEQSRLKGVVLSSPVVDLACETASFDFNCWNDTTLTGDPDTGNCTGLETPYLRRAACRSSYLEYFFGLHGMMNVGLARSPELGMYKNLTAAYDEWEARRAFFEQPAVAPLYSDYSNFPPMMVITGTRDYFYSDGLVLAQRACEAKSTVDLFTANEAFHDWIEYSEGCGSGQLAVEAVEAYSRIADFVHLHA